MQNGLENTTSAGEFKVAVKTKGYVLALIRAYRRMMVMASLFAHHFNGHGVTLADLVVLFNWCES